MNNSFQQPVVNIIRFEAEDVVTSSPITPIGEGDVEE